MENFQRKILKILEESEEALTYGEVLAKYLNCDPYFASLATNAFCSWTNVSKLGLFFKNYEEKGLKISNFYFMQILPSILRLEEAKAIIPLKINYRKRYATHSNFITDKEEKIYKRLEKEVKKKIEIKPTLVSIAQEITKEVKKKHPEEIELAILHGSASEKNGKPFIYYGNSKEIKSVSDLDITFFTSDQINLKNLSSFFDKISRERKILLNPCVRSSRDNNLEGIIKKGIVLM